MFCPCCGPYHHSVKKATAQSKKFWIRNLALFAWIWLKKCRPAILGRTLGLQHVTFRKELFPFNLRFPFVICLVSILVDTASSVLTPLKAGWNCAKSFMHEQLLVPGFRIWIGGANLLKIGRTSVYLFTYFCHLFSKSLWILLINVVEMFLPHIFTQVSWKFYRFPTDHK
jgi:hypothetical protein